MDTKRFQLIAPATFEGYRTMVAPLAEICWPEFMLHDPIANEHWGALFESFPDYQFSLYDTDSDLKFSGGGRFIIPGALNPVEMNLEKDDGLYVEPDVWIFHELT